MPEGPPPEHLELEGPGTEDLDIEDVRKALQMRWDVFQSFDEPLQNALKSQSLDEVNKVLGSMSVERAEDVVKLLDVAITGHHQQITSSCRSLGCSQACR